MNEEELILNERGLVWGLMRKEQRDALLSASKRPTMVIHFINDDGNWEYVKAPKWLNKYAYRVVDRGMSEIDMVREGIKVSTRKVAESKMKLIERIEQELYRDATGKIIKGSHNDTVMVLLQIVTDWKIAS